MTVIHGLLVVALGTPTHGGISRSTALIIIAIFSFRV